MLTRDYFKQGVIIIDVGQNRIEGVEEATRLLGEESERLPKIREKGYALVGDVHPRDPIGIAAAVTPVPGGVGPLTVAHLMKNTVIACKIRRG